MTDKAILPAIALSLTSVFSCSPAPTNPSVASPEEAGADLAIRMCSECHAIGADDFSQHPEAPPFRTLGEAYPITYLEEALAEGIMVGHPDMPVFELNPDQVDALLLYLEAVQQRID